MSAYFVILFMVGELFKVIYVLSQILSTQLTLSLIKKVQVDFKKLCQFTNLTYKNFVSFYRDGVQTIKTVFFNVVNKYLEFQT